MDVILSTTNLDHFIIQLLQLFDYYVCPDTQQFKSWTDNTATKMAHVSSDDVNKDFPHVHWNYSAVS